MTAPDAPFRFTQEENVSILVLQQELNNVQWGEIDSIGTQVLNALADRTHPNVIVDLSQLNYMGSAMVALIVRVWKATMARKGKLAVVCPHDGVREVLKLASLDKHWAITNTQAEARKAVGAGAASHKLNVDQSSDGNAWKVAAVLSTTLLLIVVVGGLIYAFRGNQPPENSNVEETEQVEVEEDGLVPEGFESEESASFEEPVIDEPEMEVETNETAVEEAATETQLETAKTAAEAPAPSDMPPALPEVKDAPTETDSTDSPEETTENKEE